MHRPNAFSGPYLDRAAHLRKDEAFVAQALADATTVIVPVWHSRNLVRRVPTGWSAVYVEVSHVVTIGVSSADLVMLGQFGGRVYFAADVPGEEAPRLLDDTLFEDLRMIGAQLGEQEAGVLAYARGILYWRHRHRYCGVCGAPNSSSSAGHVMKCSNAACATDHFPRIDPAIIVLVTDGERALLGRQASWPAGRYSTIAGFVEPGESLEDAVAREVLEETGVTVLESDYHSSQPWPFPASLMIGYTARSGTEAQPRADEELEDVRWFTREDIAAGRAGLPPPQSVSYRLIEDWYDAGSPLPLCQTPGLKLWGSGRR
ncbi:MAG TPA: NAD(+) diphosphatase [Steroidobacteraceae bacterium]